MIDNPHVFSLPLFPMIGICHTVRRESTPHLRIFDFIGRDSKRRARANRIERHGINDPESVKRRFVPDRNWTINPVGRIRNDNGITNIEHDLRSFSAFR